MQVFIRIENDFNKAMYYRKGARMQNQFLTFKGIQLLPNQEAPYIQITSVPEGIELEDVTVTVMSMCGTELQDITSYFELIDTFQDENGVNQVVWGLTNVPYDFGQQHIYLQIVNGANDYYYTSPFVLTADGEEFTSRWDYYNPLYETYVQSVGLNLYYEEDADLHEVVTYDSISLGRRRAVTSKLIDYEIWESGILDYQVFRMFKNMMRSTHVYCNFVRAGFFEAFETQRPAGDSNLSQNEIKLTLDYKDVYDPFYTPPAPEPPPPTEQSITLTEVVSLGNKEVKYTFTYEGFTPNGFIYQYSLDSETWTDVAGSIGSPHVIIIGDATDVNSYYYRILYEPLGIYSNIVQVLPASLTINNITSPDSVFNPSGNTYNIFYTIQGFQANLNIQVQASTNGTTWINITGSTQNTNPKVVNTPVSGSEFTKFRLLYPTLGITSPVYNFSF